MITFSREGARQSLLGCLPPLSLVRIPPSCWMGRLRSSSHLASSCSSNLAGASKRVKGGSFVPAAQAVGAISTRLSLNSLWDFVLRLAGFMPGSSRQLGPLACNKGLQDLEYGNIL